MSPLHTVCSPDSADTSRPPSPLSSPQTPQPTSSPSPLTRPSSPAGSRWVHKCVDTNVGFCRQPRSRTLQDGRRVNVLSCRASTPSTPTRRLAALPAAPAVARRARSSSDGLTHGIPQHLLPWAPTPQVLRRLPFQPHQ